jgi:tetratricopeptide (TPR) repeat protein
MDVSVRFVSSGIYSMLLPSLVAGLSRPEAPMPRQDAPSPADRSVRAAVALFWTAVFLCLPRYYNAGPVLSQICWPLLLGLFLWALGELLEARLAAPAPEAPAPGRMPVLAAAAGVLLLAAWGRAFAVFRGYFKADLDHNIAIFFSKSGIWSRSPEFEKSVAGLPPDMREEYARVGGALEHYQEVVRQNPYFPMARYFIGNVYSDWGSVRFSRAQEARAQGRTADADALAASARKAWDDSERAYDQVKAFAPNYVQTHHQVGTLYLKRMEMEKSMGNDAKAEEYADLALKHLGLYMTLDPVFPPNYYRIAHVYATRGEFDKAEAAFRDALVYNTSNVVNRVYNDRNAETYADLGRLLLSELGRMPPKEASDPANPVFRRAVEAFQSAISAAAPYGDDSEAARFAFDAHKGLGLLYLRAGDRGAASEHWKKVMDVNPRDPDLLAVTGRR